MVNRKELLAVLKAARPSVTSEIRRIDLAPNAEDNGLIARVICGSTTTFTAEIPAASRKWLENSFNVDFLIDFLAVHPGDTATICHEEAGEKGGGSYRKTVANNQYFLVNDAPGLLLPLCG